MLPIHGRAYVAYLPNGRVLGLSKIARVVEIFGRRLQTQENMTAQISAAINETLKPRGVAVMIEAEHMCMAMRGIQKQGATTLNTTFTGDVKTKESTKARFPTLDRNRSPPPGPRFPSPPAKHGSTRSARPLRPRLLGQAPCPGHPPRHNPTQ